MGRVIVFCLLMAFAVDSLHANNPILPDWYADPQIRLYGDTYWIFPTPSKEFKEQIYLDAFSSKDLKTWNKNLSTFKKLHIAQLVVVAVTIKL